MYKHVVTLRVAEDATTQEVYVRYPGHLANSLTSLLSNEPEQNGIMSKVLTGVRIGSRGCAKFVERANLNLRPQGIQ
jgi:hypothetical protein